VKIVPGRLTVPRNTDRCSLGEFSAAMGRMGSRSFVTPRRRLKDSDEASLPSPSSRVKHLF